MIEIRRVDLHGLGDEAHDVRVAVEPRRLNRSLDGGGVWCARKK